jgi:hypothetical protein
MMLIASSPYARRRVLWDAHRKHYGRDGDPVLVWQAATRVMNPSVPQSFIDSETEKDPQSAAAEYGANFRVDVEQFLSWDAISACVVPGQRELPHLRGTTVHVGRSGMRPPARERTRTGERRRALMARMTMMLAGGLTGLVRRFGYRDEADLLHVAFTDRADFCRRYAASPPAYHVHQVHPSMAKDYRDACDETKRKEAGEVCDEVIRECLAEEIAHQVVDAMFPFWRRPGAEPVDVDDEVVSDIGRSLLTLAERRARRASAENLSATLAERRAKWVS